MKRNTGLLIFLLNCSYLAAQNQQPDILQQQFKNYQSGVPQEKLFVHTDKTFYLAGETVWFKVYAVDASFHKPLPTSSIAYIEILNKEGKPVVQSKIEMSAGSGSGSCNLPGFLISGNYIFRAYTSWMKNFPADYYFEQNIRIVNTQKVSLPVSTASKYTASIQFFPEGGHAVNGLTGKIAFKITDIYGHGLDSKGVILNQLNDTIGSFQSLHNGMGNFQFKPEKNSTYTAVLRINDSIIIKQKLPDAEDRGLVMNVGSTDTGQLNISVRSTADFENTSVYLLIHTRQVLKIVQVSQVKDGSAIFLVDKKDLGEGISCITLFDQLRRPVCERLVFIRPREKLLIQANTGEPVYGLRKLVNINMTTLNTAGKPLEGNCSLSVFMLDSLQTLPEQSIVSWLYLSSDLNGFIESPEYYFSQPDKTADDALDNLLLTQGWRRFKWNDVIENRKPGFEFLPEIEGPVVNGKIVNKITGSAVANSTALLSIPGADYAFSSATSNGQGNIRFAFKDVFKNNALVVQPASPKDSILRVDIGNPYSEKFSSNSIRYFNVSKYQANDLLNRSISNQVENTYGMDRKRRYVKLISDTTSFYGRPDRIYYLDDYTRFQTMEEVLREYADDIRVRREGNKFFFKVRNRLFNTYFDEDPLILLDGMPISDATKIIALDPFKIKKIEVVTHIYYVGSSVFEGIININSFSGEVGATQIDPNAMVVEYEGIQQQREFYSPVYATTEEQQSHMPDFRNVLYWAPKISTGKEGKSAVSFYTSDMKGKYAVIIQGLSPDGLPGKTVGFFEVRE
jgi:hypothetical protein